MMTKKIEDRNNERVRLRAKGKKANKQEWNNWKRQRRIGAMRKNGHIQEMNNKKWQTTD